MTSGICSILAQYRKSDSLVNRLCDERFYHNCDVRLGQRIKELRRGRLTQKELARAAGLSQTTISDLERGRNAGSGEVIAIAKALGVTAEELTGRDKPSPMQADLFVEGQEELLTAWKLLTPRQRADELQRIQDMAASNVDLVRQLGHISASIDKPVSDAKVERHLPAVPGRSRALVKTKR
jgi:transcriptional regulator with XRE-family HTH domain